MRALCPVEDLGVRYGRCTKLNEAYVVVPHVPRPPDVAPLPESEARYRALAEACPDAIFVELDGACVYANPAAAHMLGAERPEQLLGRSPYEFLVAEQHESARARKAQLLAGAPVAARAEYRWVRIDGASMEIEATTVRVPWAGRPAVQIIARDVTERRRLALEQQGREQVQRTLVRLADRLAPLHDPVAIQSEAARLVGEALDADRVLYAEIDGESATVHRDWTRPGVPSITGRFAVADFGPIIDIYRRGELVCSEDVESDARLGPATRRAFARIGVRADLGIGLIKGGQWVAALTAHGSRPRRWSAEEREILTQCAERTWAAVERARAEATQRASDACYRALIENLPGGAVFVIDRDLRYRLAAGEAIAMAGIDPATFAGRTVAQAVGPQLAAQYEPYLRAALAGENFAWEHAAHARVYLSRGIPLRDHAGAIDAVLVVSTDITERRHIEQQLRESELVRRLATEGAGVGIWMQDLITGRGYWSAEAMALLRTTRREFTASDWVDVFHPEERADVAARWQQSLATNAPFEVEFRAATAAPDGSPRWLLSRGRVECDERTGEPVRGLGVLIDITERKRIEGALHGSRKRLQQVTDTAPVFIANCDRERRYRFVNRAYANRFGRHPREIVGRSIAENLGEAALAQLQPYIERVLAGEAFTNEVEVAYRDLGRRWMRCSYAPERDERGEIVGWVSALLDITEERARQAALADSEQRMRLAMEAMQADVFEWDLASGEVRRGTNDGTLVGADREAAPTTAEGWFEQVHPEDREPLRAVGVRALAARAPLVEAEYRVRHRAGHYLWVRGVSLLFYDDAGRAVRAIGCTFSIDVRRRTEDALRESETRYRTLVENLPSAAVFVIDRQLCYRLAAGEALAAVGLRADALLGRPMREVLSQELLVRLEPHLSGAFEGGSFTLEHDDAQRSYLTRGVPLPNGAGPIDALLLATMDITERKAEERRARAAEVRLEIASELAGLFAWESDLLEQTVQWSANAARVIGCTPQELPTRRSGSVWFAHPEDAERVRAQLRERLAAGAGDFEWRVRGQPLGARVRWWHTRGRIFYDPRGKAIRIVGVAQDVTAHVEREEALQAEDRRKDEFLATLAHELRNPLAPIRTAAAILRSPTLPDAKREAARAMIERQTEHLTRLVDDLLEIARLNHGQIELQRRPLELWRKLEQALETVAPVLESAGHRLTLVPPPTPLTVIGDPVRLTQVFTNLLTNAIKYTPPGGHIHLGAEADGDAVLVRVRDTGLGIPPEMRARVFEMFARVPRAGSELSGGLGIGLALAKHLVELHGGTIGVDSAGEGQGSTFWVRLPRSPESADHIEDSGIRPLPRAAGRRVLVVDDNVDAADALAMLLQLMGHTVHAVHSGSEALAVLAEESFEVVLLDIGMPQMDGYEVARRMRALLGVRVPRMIALTGYGQEIDRARAVQAGFDQHVTKPAEPAELARLIAAGEA